MAALAGCGLPGFANFIGEVMVFFGSWTSLTGITIVAMWGGLIIGAVYMLRAVRHIFHGPVSSRWDEVRDAVDPWRRLPFALLLVSLLLFGVMPRLLTDKIKPATAAVVSSVNPNPGAQPAAGAVQTAQAGGGLFHPETLAAPKR
jgi:NADH-quinone oxidoreductase subunit M